MGAERQRYKQTYIATYILTNTHTPTHCSENNFSKLCAPAGLRLAVGAPGLKNVNYKYY